MFLSKVQLSQSFQRSPYELHRQLWRLFPQQPDTQRDFLFRVEGVLPSCGLIILLQSTREPERENVLSSKPFAPVLPIGLRLRFRLRANPVRTIHDKEHGRLRQKGRRAGLWDCTLHCAGQLASRFQIETHAENV